MNPVNLERINDITKYIQWGSQEKLKFRKVLELAIENNYFVTTASGNEYRPIKIVRLFTESFGIFDGITGDPVTSGVKFYVNGTLYTNPVKANYIIYEDITRTPIRVNSIMVRGQDPNTNEDITNLNMKLTFQHFLLRNFEKSISAENFVEPTYITKNIVRIPIKVIFDGMLGLDFKVLAQRTLVLIFYVIAMTSLGEPLLNILSKEKKIKTI